MRRPKIPTAYKQALWAEVTCCSRRAVQGPACAACKHHNSQSPSHPGQHSLAHTVHDTAGSGHKGTELPAPVDAVGVRDVFTQMRPGQLARAR